MKNSKTKKTLKVILNILLWVFVVFAVFVTALVLAAQNDSNGLPSLGGKCLITVESPSMSPTFDKGDMIISQKLTSDEEKQSLQVGDVVTYPFKINGVDTFNTHRIVEVIKDENGNVVSYITRGDNKETNTANDKDPVPYRLAVAKWNGTKFSSLGRFLGFLRTSTGFLVIIVIPLILFFVYELIHFIFALNSVRKKDKKEITAADEEEIKRRAIEEYLKQQQAEGNKENLEKKTDEIDATVKDKVEEVKTETEDKVEEVKTGAEDKVEEAKTEVEEKVEEINSETEEVKTEAEAKIEEIRSDAEEIATEVVNNTATDPETKPGE